MTDQPDLPPELMERVAEILWKPTADYGETWAKTHSRTKLTYRHRAREVVTIVRAQGRAEAQAEVVDADREAAEKAFDIAFRGDTDGIDDAMASLFTNRAALALAEVVAWLRETDWGDDDDDLYGALAASIEAGDHRKEVAKRFDHIRADLNNMGII